jgi:hypothetical protein
MLKPTDDLLTKIEYHIFRVALLIVFVAWLVKHVWHEMELWKLFPTHPQ